MSDTEVAQPVLTEGTCRVDQELFNHKSWKLLESHKNQWNIISTMAKNLEFSKFLKHDIVVCLYAKLGVQSQLYIVCYSSTLPLSLSLLY